MFKLAQKRAVTWPVTVNIPQDGGRTAAATFTAEFEVFTTDEMDSLSGQGKLIAEEALIGWKGVAGEDGQEMAFSPENKEKLLKLNYVKQALMFAYQEVQQGRAAARKN